ncbi:MAG: PorV/PorQ family protein [Candidatus Marinimicrobia bacterium]|nr:PorV/PorQ family protein [Candidatus Neomarinimicrobiota bacterium]MCF7923232.1 PorV/PorQ family protein [Candidatus Neomarinimicrobiota bacterium]
MKHKIILLILLLTFTSAGFADYTKLAQTGFQFLSVISDARGAAMGGAMTTIPYGSGSLFFNPACMAEMEAKVDVIASKNSWFAGINHTTISLAINPANNRYGVIGFTAQSVNYGDIQGTMVWGTDQGWVETNKFTPSSISLGAGYAVRLSDRFSIGTQVKYAAQQLGTGVLEINPTEIDKQDSLAVNKFSSSAIAFDFGTLFKTGFKGIAFGMNVRNFSNEISFIKENFQLPLTFTMGLSMNLMELVPQMADGHSLMMSVDAVHSRSYPEYLNIGMEYKLLDMLYLRYGFLTNRDERNSSFGFGVSKYGLGVDYAYIPFGILDEVQMITVRFTY